MKRKVISLIGVQFNKVINQFKKGGFMKKNTNVNVNQMKKENKGTTAEMVDESQYVGTHQVTVSKDYKPMYGEIFAWTFDEGEYNMYKTKKDAIDARERCCKGYYKTKAELERNWPIFKGLFRPYKELGEIDYELVAKCE